MQARSWFVNLVFTLFVQTSLGARQARCDTSKDALVHDGYMGESPIFNWLGILRVHLHDGDTTRIALTGVVLIKENFALANADDISRIPMQVFQQESKIMFIPQNSTPWYCQPLTYVTHPEYEYSTYNTIAVIELALDDVETYPLRPICWPRGMMNTSNDLYVTGYTDDHKFLEKIVYKMQYVDKTMCEQFYKKAGLSAENRIPLYYQCGFTASEHGNCVWDNGMALISNVTGWFTLIGLGVRGPGCAAPSRFLDIYQYLQWLELVTTLNEVDDYGDYRRSGNRTGFEYIPAHELMLNGSNPNPLNGIYFHKYPFEAGTLQHFNVEQTESNAFMITPSNISQDKITLYDFYFMYITCVKLIKPQTLTKEQPAQNSEETPEHLFTHFLMTERTGPTGPTEPTGPTQRPEPETQLKLEFIKNNRTGLHEKLNITNANVIINFQFEGEVVFKLQMYGKRKPPFRKQSGHKRRQFYDRIFRRFVDTSTSSTAYRGPTTTSYSSFLSTFQWLFVQ